MSQILSSLKEETKSKDKQNFYEIKFVKTTTTTTTISVDSKTQKKIKNILPEQADFESAISEDIKTTEVKDKLNSLSAANSKKRKVLFSKKK